MLENYCDGHTNGHRIRSNNFFYLFKNATLNYGKKVHNCVIIKNNVRNTFLECFRLLPNCPIAEVLQLLTKVVSGQEALAHALS